MILRVVTTLAMSVLVLPGPATDAFAQSFSPGQAHDAVRNGDIVPLKDIFTRLEREFGGYQLDAELFSTADGGSEYRIVWMSDEGRRLQIVVNAQTGRVESVRGG